MNRIGKIPKKKLVHMTYTIQEGERDTVVDNKTQKERNTVLQ